SETGRGLHPAKAVRLPHRPAQRAGRAVFLRQSAVEPPQIGAAVADLLPQPRQQADDLLQSAPPGCQALPPGIPRAEPAGRQQQGGGPPRPATSRAPPPAGPGARRPASITMARTIPFSRIEATWGRRRASSRVAAWRLAT